MEYLSLFMFKGAKLANEHQKQDAIKLATDLYHEVSKHYSCNPVFYCSKDEKGKWHFEYATVQLKNSLLNIDIQPKTFKGKYLIYADDIRNLPFITNYEVEKASNEIGKPKEIGKLSATKIFAWVLFYEKLYKEVKRVSDESVKRIEEFRKSIKGLPIEWNYKSDTVGQIVKNGITFTFAIESNGHIDQRLKVDLNVERSVKVFKQLSDNKYKAPRK